MGLGKAWGFVGDARGVNQDHVYANQAWTALDIPPAFRVTGVRVGYENSNVRSFITCLGMLRTALSCEESGYTWSTGSRGC